MANGPAEKRHKSLGGSSPTPYTNWRLEDYGPGGGNSIRAEIIATDEQGADCVLAIIPNHADNGDYLPEAKKWAALDLAVANMLAAAPDLYRIATSLEWAAEVDADEGGTVPGCPWCDARMSDGHAGGCFLAAILDIIRAAPKAEGGAA